MFQLCCWRTENWCHSASVTDCVKKLTRPTMAWVMSSLLVICVRLRAIANRDLHIHHVTNKFEILLRLPAFVQFVNCGSPGLRTWISDMLTYRSSRVGGRRVHRPRRRFIPSSVAVRWWLTTMLSSPSTLISNLYSRLVSTKLWNLRPASWNFSLPQYPLVSH